MSRDMADLLRTVGMIIVICFFLIAKAPFPIYNYAATGGLFTIGITLLVILMEWDEQNESNEENRWK